MSTINPQDLVQALALFKQGQALQAAGDTTRAADAYRLALKRVPDHPDMLLASGQLAEQRQDWATAERCYRRLLAVRPVANLDGKLGHMLYNLERYAEAVPLLAAYAGRHPGDGVVRRYLSTCCFRSGRLEEGYAHAREAWAKEQHPDAMSLMLAALLEMGHGDAMSPLVEEALARFPHEWQVRKLSSEHLLKAGDYARGFDLFADLRTRPGEISHYLETLDAPWWHGERFDGTLLVGGEQGIGDEILASSMYADIARLGQPAVIETDRRLVALMRRNFPTLAFVPRNEDRLAAQVAAGGTFRKILSGSLGGVFRREVAAFPAGAGWLSADPGRAAAFAARYDARWPGLPRVGIAWKSQRALNSGERKAVDVTAFAPLLRDVPAAFVNLQYGDIRDDLASLGADASRVYVDPDVDTYHDMDALFAQVAALDAVACTSNVTAHIAGALGKPCFVILPKDRPVIWYWGYRGDRTPWYPATRLLRNTRGNDDWVELFATLAEALRGLAGR